MAEKALRAVLESVGLTAKEAQVYLALLECSEGSPAAIAKKSGLKRPTTYLILEALVEAGLASYAKKGRGITYRPLSPYALAEMHSAKLDKLRNALPDLASLSGGSAYEPQMAVFQGKKGLIQIMEDTLSSTKDILVWADMAAIVDGVFEDYWADYIRKRVSKRIWVRAIMADTPASREFKKTGEKELREVHLISHQRFPLKNEINIYDDKVAIISHSDMVGVIIQNRNIADTQRSIFRFCFQCSS